MRKESLKQRAEKLLEELKSGKYDQEAAHGEYDTILEDFIANYDPQLSPLIIELINTPKSFWYA